jgi:PTH1 family peptidyl-tRNA hydrolase
VTPAAEAAADDRRVLVVGLGNPEADYGGTRHNVGADTVRLLARRHHRDLDRNKRIRAEATELTLSGGQRLALVVPSCFMNESGGPVQAATRWYDTAPSDVVVVHDELDLPVGRLRVKWGGGNGGHKGLKDVDRALGTGDYGRVRIGIGRPPGRQPARDHVLRRFSPRDREIVDVVLEHAADAVESLATDGVDTAQNHYNALDLDTQ